MSASSDNKRIAKNTVLLYVDLIVSSLIWLYASRVLLEALGVDDFGLYNVVGGIVVLLNVLNTAMISTSYRYIAYELGKDDGNPDVVFNTCRNIHALISILVLAVGWPVGDYYVTHYLNIGTLPLADARFVYMVSIFTCAITTFTVPYLGLITATERFAFKAGINICRSIVRLALILTLLHIAADRLRIYSVYAFLVEVGVATAYILICGKYCKNIVRWVWVKSKHLYKEMFDFTFLILLGAVARIGKSQGAAIIINLFFGTILNAAYAIANQVNGFVSMATNSLSQAAVPQITKSYSGGDKGRSLEIVVYISKYTFIMMLLVCTPFLMQTQYILGVWLTEVPEYSATFVNLILLDAMITCLGAGIPSLYQATGKIKAFQIALSVILLASLPLGWLAYKMGYSPGSLLVVYCILSLIDRIVAVLLLRYKLNIDIKPLLRFSYLNSFKLSLFLLPLYWVNMHFTGNVASPIAMIISEVFMLSVVYTIGLNSKERCLVKSFGVKVLNRIKR